MGVTLTGIKALGGFGGEGHLLPILPALPNFPIAASATLAQSLCAVYMSNLAYCAQRNFWKALLMCMGRQKNSPL